MKKLFLLPLILLMVAAQAQTIRFLDNDWNKAREEAKAQNKYIFVDAYTDWCYWCKVMDKQTFPDKEVVKFMGENFVALKLEMEHNYGINVAMKYRVRSFPSFLVFAPNGKLVYKMAGYMEPAAFIAELKKALAPAQKEAYAGVSNEVDLAFPDFYKSVFGGKKNRPDAATINTYLDGQKDLFSEINYSVLVTFASLLSDKNQAQLLDNRKKYEQLFGAGDIENAIYALNSKLLKAAIESKKEEDLKAALAFMEKYQANDLEANKSNLLLNYYKGIEEWGQMAKQVDVFIEKNGYDGGRINDWAWTVYEKCGDTDVVKKAIAWMKPVIEKKAEYATTDTYAALLYKAKQFAEAQTYAKKAIALGKAEGQKTDETEQLLKKIEAAK